MPQWIHDRADHIRAKNPGMPESQSFAIATQQAYAAGKAPKKGFGTAAGKREAKQKYDEPKKNYKKTADPGHMSKSASFSAMWMGFSDELLKIAAATTVSDVTKAVKPPGLKPPKMTSRPVEKEPDPPASTLDHLSSSRTLQPPPVTSGG
jgi:hypothetical protein